MSTPGSELAGLLFIFTIASIMLWLGAGFLPFSVQVSSWFKKRLKDGGAVAALGGQSASDNMSPGQVVFFSIASIVAGVIVVWNVGGSIAEAMPAGAGSPTRLLVAIFVGAAFLVGGVVVALLARSRLPRRRPTLIALGVCMVIFGSAMIVVGGLLPLGAGSASPT